MDKIVIKGCGHHDGEWELDFENLSHRELHTVKRVSGIRIGELEEALNVGDSDVLVAIAIITLQRHGRDIEEDVLWDSEVGSISLAADTNQVPEPPLDPPKPPPQSETNGGSGDATSTSSDLPASLPSRTGVPI